MSCLYKTVATIVPVKAFCLLAPTWTWCVRVHVCACMLFYDFLSGTGCWFAPQGTVHDRVWVDVVSQHALMRVDSHSNAKDLTGALLDLLYTPEELATGNATKTRSEGISLLNGSKLNVGYGLVQCTPLSFGQVCT